MGATVSEVLSGRALAEAAAKVMGLRLGFEDNYGEPSSPDVSASVDYMCLEWARENWQSDCDPAWSRFVAALEGHNLAHYEPGMWARALVAAAGEK